MTVTRNVLFASIAAAVLLGAGAAVATLGPGTLVAAPPALDAPTTGSAEESEHALPFGPVRPARPLPDAALVRHDGKAVRLADETTGAYTIVNLFFAGCTTTCPVQGAIFRAAEERLKERGIRARLLSISVDALGDGPDRLAAWLKAQGAGPEWRAATPSLDGVAALVDALQGRGKTYDVHDARAYLVDPRGRLVFVTEDMPAPDALADLVAAAQAHAASNGAAAFD